MFYIQVAHTNDEDCDLYRHPLMSVIAAFIVEEEICDFLLSDMLPAPYQEDDFTFIGKEVN